MLRLILALTILSLPFYASAGEFKVKLNIETVDHHLSGIRVTAMHRGKDVAMHTSNKDGNVKMKLEEGKLYHLWVEMNGYTPVVIHNVHADGDTKFNVVLYKARNTVPSKGEKYLGTMRQFVSVEKMVIPEEELSKGVQVIKRAEITPAESKSLSKLASYAKKQGKSQKKLDKLAKKEAKLRKSIQGIDGDIAGGNLDATEGEAKKLKLQNKLVKIKKGQDKLAY